MKRDRNVEGSNDFLSRSILMDFIKEGETIGTAAAVIQVDHFSLPRRIPIIMILSNLGIIYAK